MNLDNIISVQISRQTSAPTQRGFGTALFIAETVPTGYTTRVKAYSSLEEMDTDGWTSSMPAYKAAQVYFGQELKPELLYIGIKQGAETYVQALSSIRSINDDWYVLMTESHSQSDVTALAAVIETLVKLYFVSSDDSIIPTDTNTDIASVLKSSNYNRTSIMYHTSANTLYPEAAWLGLQLPKQTGSSTWKFKTLNGVSSVALDSSQINYIKSKNCNYYTTAAGVAITAEGVMSSGEFIDVMQGVDFIQSRIQEHIFSALINEEKIPYTDAGVSVIVNIIKQVLTNAVSNNILSADPAPVVEAPLVINIPATTRATRLLPDVKFKATLAGAIHKIQIQGTVSV